MEELKVTVRTEIPKALAYVSGQLMEDYIHDMKIVQRFAMLNRKAMMDELIRGMKLKVEEEFTTIHNYIDTDHSILRKGAVSAKLGEKLLIPINMRDGSLICIGKGNEDWNFSAPHGAGRLMSRTAAKNSFTLSEFKKQMKDIYTTSGVRTHWMNVRWRIRIWRILYRILEIQQKLSISLNRFIILRLEKNNTEPYSLLIHFVNSPCKVCACVFLDTY